jgi:hypothetical protein
LKEPAQGYMPTLITRNSNIVPGGRNLPDRYLLMSITRTEGLGMVSESATTDSSWRVNLAAATPYRDQEAQVISASIQWALRIVEKIDNVFQK